MANAGHCDNDERENESLACVHGTSPVVCKVGLTVDCDKHAVKPATWVVAGVGLAGDCAGLALRSSSAEAVLRWVERLSERGQYTGRPTARSTIRWADPRLLTIAGSASP